MSVATAVFVKTFDSISHQSFWKLLEKFGIESFYVCFLGRLYAEQKGSDSTDKESDMFEIKRRSRKILLSTSALQRGASNGTERRCGTLAKIKKAWVIR